MSSLISFAGIASGIDSNSLIKALLDQQRTARVKPLQDKITKYQETNSSFDDLSDLLGKLNTATQKFRALNGGALAKTTTSSDETVATATASNGAANGAVSVSVSQLARNGTQSFNDRFASGSSVINSSINNGAAAANRTVSFTIGTGSNQESVDVELTNTTTADQFVSSFNAASDNAEATLVNVGTSSSPSYAIVISGNSQGSQQGQIAYSVGSEVTSAGSGAFTTATLSQAIDAQFTVSGVNGTITRSSNTITDVISGVSLNLRATGSATLNIADDASSTATVIQDFVDAYNDVVKFVGENDRVLVEDDGDERKVTFGPLADTSLDEGLLSSLRQAFSSASSTGRSVNTLADLGVSTQRDGTLKFDTEAFKTALANDSEGVRLVTENLGEILGTVDGTIAQYTRFNGLIDVNQTANSTEISSLQSRISDVEKSLSKQEDSLVQRYSRLEATMGKLQSQQQTLSSLLR